MKSVPVKNIEQHLAELAKIGNLGPALKDGFLRASWSDEETAAMQYISTVGCGAGLEPRFDAVGNLYLRTRGTGDKVIQIGSHLDTVVRGGLFDGGAGIIAGLEAILAAKEQMDSDEFALELVIWRGEESGTYNIVYKGSKAAFGSLPEEALQNEFQGQTLKDAIVSQGFDPSCIEKGLPTLSKEYIDSIHAHFELHIEQARALEIDGDDIGICTSIRSPRRFRILVKGEAAHSGATPMGVKYRQDANLCIAAMQIALDELGKTKSAEGNDLVQTVGVVNSDADFNKKNSLVYENGITKVSAFGYFTLDVRSNNKAFLDSYVADIKQLIAELAGQYRTEAEITHISGSDPVESLDPDLQDILEQAVQHCGYRYQRLASGAGHDVAVVAQQKKTDGTTIPAALVFIPCRNGISHNPLEYTSAEAIQKGASVLATALQTIISN